MTILRAGAALALCFGLSASAFGAGGEGREQPPGPVSGLVLAYDLYMAGVSLGHVDVSARIDGASYRAQSTLDTKGLINAFWQAHIEASSNGSVGPASVRPAVYDSFSRHRDKRQQVTVTYGPEGPVHVLAEPPYSARYPVTDEQRRNTVDPLSAMVYVTTGASASAKNPCGTAAPVYDGRRRYDIQLIYVRTKTIAMDNGAYSGPAMVCQIKYVQIAGFKQKILDEGKRIPSMFAWLVSLAGRSDPARRYLIPVRLWAETEWGTAAAVATRVQLDGVDMARAR